MPQSISLTLPPEVLAEVDNVRRAQWAKTRESVSRSEAVEYLLWQALALAPLGA